MTGSFDRADGKEGAGWGWGAGGGRGGEGGQ